MKEEERGKDIHTPSRAVSRRKQAHIGKVKELSSHATSARMYFIPKRTQNASARVKSSSFAKQDVKIPSFRRKNRK